MASFIHYILSGLIQLMIFAIIGSAILSWLIAFNVLNSRNQFVYSIARFLDAVTRPMLRPFQKVIPPLGGVDISPIFAILVLSGIQIYLLPMAMAPLKNLMG